MPRFRFKAYDSSGRLELGELGAEDARAATDALVRRGLYPVHMETRSEGSRHPRLPRQVGRDRTLPLQQQAALVRELATLIKAGIPIDEALRVLALQPRVRRQARGLVEAVLHDITTGSSLSEALAARRDALPEHFARMVRAGESSGTLPQVLGELADLLEQRQRMRQQLVTALLYPAFLCVAAVVTLAVIVVVMVPAILPLFRDAGRDPPALISALSAIERVVAGSPPVAAAALGAVVLLAAWVRRSERANSAWHGLALRLPVVNQLVRRRCTASFARTLSTLVRNDVPLLEALQVTAGVMPNRLFERAVRDAAEALNKGGSLTEQLSAGGLFPPLALRLVSLGEQSGQLPLMLSRLAETYELDTQQQLERLLAVAAPAITLAIGGFVGLLILSVVSAMLSLNEMVLM